MMERGTGQETASRYRLGADRRAPWAPDARLVDFLAAGEAPVYVGFGSMGFGKGAAERRAAVLGALAAHRLRGIVATGWGGLVRNLGAGPAPVPARTLAAGLTERLGELVHTPSYRRRAADIGERLRDEDGLGRGVEVIEAHARC